MLAQPEFHQRHIICSGKSPVPGQGVPLIARQYSDNIRRSNGGQRLVEIGDQIIRVFDTD